jgi:rhomboid protease GluP
VHVIVLYLCAGAVVAAGMQVLVALAGPEEPGPPWLLLRRIWTRPVPWTAFALVSLMAIMAVAQTVHPALIGDLQRDPAGGWWRCVTALLVQSSGAVQLFVNLAALVVVAPIAERTFGAVAMLAVYLLAGVSSHLVSAAGWSPHGAGNSVAIYGLVGALAVFYLLRGDRLVPRRLAVLVPAAAIVLCVLTNNHGIGLAVGCLLGVPLARIEAALHSAMVDAGVRMDGR